MKIKGIEVTESEFISYFSDHFPEDYDRISQSDKLILFRKGNDYNKEVISDVVKSMRDKLRSSDYEWNYLATHETCEMSGDLDVNVERYNKKDIIKANRSSWLDFFHFTLKYRRSLLDNYFSLYQSVDDATTTFLQMLDNDEEYDSKEDIEASELLFQSSIASLLTYSSDFKVSYSDDLDVSDYDSAKNKILKDNENLDGMFQFKNENIISEKELEYIKKYDLKIVLETYNQKQRITRTIEIQFNKRLNGFTRKVKETQCITNCGNFMDREIYTDPDIIKELIIGELHNTVSRLGVNIVSKA